jgi:hypothetical protein
MWQKNESSMSLRLQLCLIVAFMIPSIMSCRILGATSDDAIEFPSDRRVDRSFVSGQPCEAPCWYGLELGKASFEEIRTTLSSLPFINSEGIREYESNSSGEMSFITNCVYSSPDEDCIWIETSADGTLRQITLKIYYPLTLESAIRQLGKPSYYISDPISGKDACTIHVYWPNASISAILETAPKERYCIGEKSEKVNLGDQIKLLIYTTIEAQQDGIPWIVDQ